MSAEYEHCGVALTLFASLRLPIRGVKAESLSHSLLNPAELARVRHFILDSGCGVVYK